MGFRFRKNIKIAPGVTFRINKKSVSTSFGGRHAGININSKRGASARLSAPGTGISYTTKISSKKRPSRRSSSARYVEILDDSTDDYPETCSPPAQSYVPNPPSPPHLLCEDPDLVVSQTRSDSLPSLIVTFVLLLIFRHILFLIAFLIALIISIFKICSAKSDPRARARKNIEINREKTEKYNARLRAYRSKYE